MSHGRWPPPPRGHWCAWRGPLCLPSQRGGPSLSLACLPGGRKGSDAPWPVQIGRSHPAGAAGRAWREQPGGAGEAADKGGGSPPGGAGRRKAEAGCSHGGQVRSETPPAFPAGRFAHGSAGSCPRPANPRQRRWGGAGGCPCRSGGVGGFPPRFWGQNRVPACSAQSIHFSILAPQRALPNRVQESRLSSPPSPSAHGRLLSAPSSRRILQ